MNESQADRDLFDAYLAWYLPRRAADQARERLMRQTHDRNDPLFRIHAACGQTQ